MQEKNNTCCVLCQLPYDGDKDTILEEIEEIVGELTEETTTINVNVHYVCDDCWNRIEARLNAENN